MDDPNLAILVPVAKVLSIPDYHAMEQALAQRGFRHDLSPEAPICRWEWQGALLDLKPSEPGILSFHNRWYPLVVETATPMTLPGGMTIR